MSYKIDCQRYTGLARAATDTARRNAIVITTITSLSYISNCRGS